MSIATCNSLERNDRRTNVNESSTYGSTRPLADIRIVSLTKEKGNLIHLVNMAENEKWEVQGLIGEDDEQFGLLLDDVYMATLMEEDMDSKSRSHKALRHVKYRIPPCMRKKELWRHGRDQGPQRKRKTADNHATNRPFLQQLSTG